MSIYYVDGIGAYDYNALIAKQNSGKELNFKEQSFVYLFPDALKACPEEVVDVSNLSDDEVLAKIHKHGLETTFYDDNPDPMAASEPDDDNLGIVEETVWEGDTMVEQHFYGASVAENSEVVNDESLNNMTAKSSNKSRERTFNKAHKKGTSDEATSAKPKHHKKAKANFLSHFRK